MSNSAVYKCMTGAAGVAALVLLGGCFGASVLVADPTLGLSVCPAKQETSYTAVFVAKDGARREVKRKVNAANLEKAPVYRLPGRMFYPEHAVTRDMAWIRFTVYCGDSAEPALVTPRITPKDLFDRGGDKEFYYIVE